MFALSTVSLIMFLALLSAFGNGLLLSRVRALKESICEYIVIPVTGTMRPSISELPFVFIFSAVGLSIYNERLIDHATVRKDNTLPHISWTECSIVGGYHHHHEGYFASARARRQVETDERNQREAPNKKEEESMS